MSYQREVSAFYVRITKVLLGVLNLNGALQEKLNMSISTALLGPMALHTPWLKASFTRAASPLGVMTSLNWRKRNTGTLTGAFLSAGGRQSPGSAGRREPAALLGCTTPKAAAPLHLPWKDPGSEWDVSIMLTPEVSSTRGPHCDRASTDM